MPWILETTAYVAPMLGQLPPDKTNGRRLFQVIGMDFAELMIYKGNKDSLKQAYILLITCSWSRAVHLELIGSQTSSIQMFCGRTRKI